MTIKKLLPSDDASPVSVDAWQNARMDIIKRLFDTLGHPPVDRHTRDIEILEEQDQDDYRRQKIRYIVGEDDPVYAFLFIPHNLDVPAPAVVAMHQTVSSGKNEVAGLDGHPDFAYGHELAKRGYVVIVPDYLTAGERTYPNQESFESGPFYEQYPAWSMVGKNVEDSMAAVDVLHTLTYVNKDRIGVIGHSHGGHNAIFAAALDERIKVCVSNCGMSVFSEEEERLEWSLEDGYIYIPALRKYFLANEEPPFELHEVAALIAPRPWLNVSAYHDMAYGNQAFLAEVGVQFCELYKLYGKTEAFAYFMHGNDHSFPLYVRSTAYAWLDRYLK